jgi:hypothetical protein
MNFHQQSGFPYTFTTTNRQAIAIRVIQVSGRSTAGTDLQFALAIMQPVVL